MFRTSENDPIRIDEVPCAAGVIGLSFCPGKVGPSLSGSDWNRNLRTDIAAIRSWGASAVVTLMEEPELEFLQVRRMADEVEDRVMDWHHLPIRDVSVPDHEFELRWTYSGHMIRQLLRDGRKVFIHCRGGRGRAGMVAARLLVEFGSSPKAAIASVRSARPGTIETRRQEEYVMECQPPKVEPGHADRVLGCLFGGALGDAFGYAIEFLRLPEIYRKFGRRGLFAPVPDQDKLVVSDDTQMTLFTGEGLCRALSCATSTNAEILREIRGAYLTWLRTQETVFPTAQPAGVERFQELWRNRAPGATCTSALRAGGSGSVDAPINHSKGCGGVMRVAPLGLVPGVDGNRAFDMACQAAALTHGHPSGYFSAGALAGIIRDLLADETLASSLGRAKSRLGEGKDQAETLSAINWAWSLAQSDMDANEAIFVLGEGWVGDEALAIGIFAALRASTFNELIRIAANHDGDSDATASIAGQIWGAEHGTHRMTHSWLRRLDTFLPICDIASKLLSLA